MRFFSKIGSFESRPGTGRQSDENIGRNKTDAEDPPCGTMGPIEISIERGPHPVEEDFAAHRR